MRTASALSDTLKRELKARAITYADLAARIAMSEASVKRMFSQKNFTLARLDQILLACDIAFSDLTAGLNQAPPLTSQLSWAQEQEIIGDMGLFVVAVSCLNQLTVAQMTSVYHLNAAQVTSSLLRLDKIGFLQLLPNNRIKLLVSRTFRWIPDGPIQAYFRELIAFDYLDAKFDADNEVMQLINVMLSKPSAASLVGKLRQLAEDFSRVHQEDAKLPFEDRQAITFLVAARPWLPKAFDALLRKDLQTRRHKA